MGLKMVVFNKAMHLNYSFDMVFHFFLEKKVEKKKSNIPKADAKAPIR